MPFSQDSAMSDCLEDDSESVLLANKIAVHDLSQIHLT